MLVGRGCSSGVNGQNEEESKGVLGFSFALCGREQLKKAEGGARSMALERLLLLLLLLSASFASRVPAIAPCVLLHSAPWTKHQRLACRA